MTYGIYDGAGPAVSQPDDPSDPSLKVSRMSPATGGVKGELKAAMLVETEAQPAWQSYEWNALFRLENYANAGENTGCSIAANQWGSGPTWGLQLMVQNRSGRDDGILYGMELDLCSTGTDPQNKRQGIALFFGDAYPNSFNPVGPKVRSYAGMTINPFAGMERATLGYGVEMGGNVNEGIGFANVGETAISAYGSFSRAVLWTAGTTNSPLALKMGPGQTIAFASGPGNGAPPVWSSGAFVPFFVGALRIQIDGQDTGLYLPVCNNHP